MKYYHNLYISENLEAKRTDIISNIMSNKWQFEKYLIVLTENKKNHLEFFDSVLLLQNVISKDNLFVIGIAEGYQGALDLVQKIAEEVYLNTDETDIRGYLLAKEQEYEESKV